MPFTWTKESPPRWDAAKRRILGGTVLGFDHTQEGELLAGEWWRADDHDTPVGYGWIDMNWGDGEMLLAVDPAWQRKGVGSFILDHLQEEARHHGLYYLYNVVPASHPDPAALSAWLEKRGFKPHGDGRLKRAVTPRR